MMSDKCNGWTNWETWLVGVWYPDLQEHFMGADFVDAQMVEDLVDEMTSREDLPNNGLIRDLITAAWSRINWYEIATHIEEDLESSEELVH